MIYLYCQPHMMILRHERGICTASEIHSKTKSRASFLRQECLGFKPEDMCCMAAHYL